MLDFDFTKLDSVDFKKHFKEDLVREFIIAPLLKILGFKLQDSIHIESSLEVRLSHSVKSPTIIGSNKRIESHEMIIPDYILYVDSKPHCALDAKAPIISIESNSKAERQVFYYAINKDIKTPYYALCNGVKFMLFATNGQEVLLDLALYNLNQDHKDYGLLKQYLTKPIELLRQNLQLDSKPTQHNDSWYLTKKLPSAITNPQKQAKARYFGCTAYFTRQSWDIVTQNILNFTDKGDVVLDLFGGSGVTAIEAMMNNRIGIHTDLNPLSIFMVKALAGECNLGELYEISEEIVYEFENLKPQNEKEIKQILKYAKYYHNAIDSEFGITATQKQQDSVMWIPQNATLPKGSDVDSVLQLFSQRQLVELAILRKLIFKKTTPSKNQENKIKKKKFTL